MERGVKGLCVRGACGAHPPPCWGQDVSVCVRGRECVCVGSVPEKGFNIMYVTNLKCHPMLHRTICLLLSAARWLEGQVPCLADAQCSGLLGRSSNGCNYEEKGQGDGS